MMKDKASRKGIVHIPLDGQWSFRQVGRGAKRVARWQPAQVPGTVHQDLLAAGVIDDPFVRDHENQMRWVEYAEWAYLRTFELDARQRDEARRVYLEADGLDTFATIRLNGKVVGATDNMFHPWRFEVSQYLKAGTNRLEITFASAAQQAEQAAAKSKVDYRSSFFKPRVHIRKAQYAGGWDWGPRLLTCGIWRPIRLTLVRDVAITDVWARTTSISPKEATVRVETCVEACTAGSARCELELIGPDGKRMTETVRRNLSAGSAGTLRSDLKVPRPSLWWPAGMGEQALYELRVKLMIGDEVADTREMRIGLRKVELIRTKDRNGRGGDVGESFMFRVNGRDVFCKGANWVPPDSFLPRFTRQKYFERVADARDANMNMLRIWGGGIYEDPAFYEACDRMGIMVWQDFMFACAEYPEDRGFLASVQREAEAVVRQLRNHASIVLWCGNNENQWGYDEWWPPRPKRYGEVIYDKVLPKVCKRLDPTREYWPGSPYGGETANHHDFGDQHEWGIWIGWADATRYLANRGRFISEFGFQAMPCMKTVKGYTDATDRWLFSPVIDHHNKMEDGHPRNMKFLAGGYGVPGDLEEYVYLSQVSQADAIKMGVEHWRRRWPETAGALYWQHNDCWPVTSWSGMDYHGRPKALWYATRRFFSPTLVTLRPVEDAYYGPFDVEVWVTHDGPDKLEATLELIGCSLDGRKKKTRKLKVRVPGNRAQQVGRVRFGELGIDAVNGDVLFAQVRRGREVLSANLHCYAPSKHLDWSDPGLKVGVRAADDGLAIELTSGRVARAVCLEADRWEGRFSDNFFDLVPGQTRTLVWTPAGRTPSASTFRKALRCWSLASVKRR